MERNPDDVGKSGESSKPLEEEVPDPDEDDLDDLDDILDEFSATQIDTKRDAPALSGPGRPADTPTSALPEEPDAAHDFGKQLQEQMAALMGEIDESPEMRQQIENMMKEISTAAEAVPPSGNTHGGPDTTSPPASSSGAEESFQETIRKTMERMQTSGEQATAAATSDDSDDILAQMLKDMQGGGLGGAGGDEDFSKMLMGMMEQLTNKDILYEPMKELHDKFPGWMTKNRSSTKPDDLSRYEEQQRLVKEIVGKFEEKGYSDSNAADREYIVERMQKARLLILLPLVSTFLISSTRCKQRAVLQPI
ncbi:Pex19 protein [Lasallia pustulata]|uniref:Pex19 protein n=1 Tax=Lasallia pustulata TaxID=136370 RepID=A0A1W5DD68_9LECA|nr:Pex19 protein [Lasallia pustulata]